MPELIPFLCGLLAIGFMVWVLLPSACYRETKAWVAVHESETTRAWLRYSTVRRLFSPTRIAMNAVSATEFSPEDLDHLNHLFRKLGQEPASAISPAVGDRFDPKRMTATNAVGPPSDGWVILQLLKFGVYWSGASQEVMKPALVESCSADRLMLLRSFSEDSCSASILSMFREYLEKRDPPNAGFSLDASLLRGFIDSNMLESEVEQLFTVLCESHPTGDYVLIKPQVGQDFNGDIMTAVGGEIPSRACKVTEVSHPGLARQDDRKWLVRARVKIKNLPR